MGNPIQEVYASEQYCKDEIMCIRDMFGSVKTFTLDNCNAAIKSLGFMLLYCPENIKTHVEATLYELELRINYGPRWS
jgi:hypothetical protein